MKKLLFIAVISLTLTACASYRAVVEYNNLAAEAASEISLAKKTGFLWSNTENFVKKAEEDKNAGNIDDAIKGLKKAIREAKLAQAQAKEQANAKAPY
ncbi:MAG: hypothetical protein AAB329_05940 [Pseudomonadota bacterium]|mgnify:CR=1 FL=1